MALPNDKISTTLVANTLGTSSRDVGTLCTHQAINKWSKWKPIRANTNGAGIEPIDLATVNYGLEFPNFSNVEDLIAYYKTTNEWKYNRPRGGAFNEMYRIGDFRNYEHDAQRFYNIDVIPDRVYSNATELEIAMWNSPYESLKWEDFNFSNLTNFHFGGIIQGAQPWEMVQGTSPTPLPESGRTFADIPLNILPKFGTYNVYAYIARTLGGNPINYYPLDEGNLGSFYFTAPPVKLTVNLDGTINIFGRVDWVLNIINYSYRPMMYNVTVKLRYGDNHPIDDPMELGEGQEFLGDINVENGFTASGRFNMPMEEYERRGAYMFFQHMTSVDNNYNRSYSLIEDF